MLDNIKATAEAKMETVKEWMEDHDDEVALAKYAIGYFAASFVIIYASGFWYGKALAKGIKQGLLDR